LVLHMPNLLISFALGAIAPVLSIGWLIAYH
jgi:hypothetical protein